ncbi:thiopeptide-type bacteriocin biosynthesis protein [Micromonospora echinospora]|uniref:thiopeptide-type bacteriocin biosynthesis protein n=1 Tax=Micromonospora echinospora TaxID=1877 RepID=UPI003A83F218
MTSSPWRQITIELPDQTRADDIAVTHLGPLLAEAEASKLIAAWFFIRKTPQWRLRYLPTAETPKARAHLLGRLDTLTHGRRITRTVEVVYEPETRAFGGAQALTVAHRLWHADSRHVLHYLAATAADPTTRRRRELAVLLTSALLRAAGLDWYEQGDVWSKVSHHRPQPDDLDPHATTALHSTLRRLMNTDLATVTPQGTPLAAAADWAASFATAGHDLAYLAAAGDLHRGLRDVLAHHVIFAMNRLGLPATIQAVLATNAATVTFGPDPTTRPSTRSDGRRTTSALTDATSPGAGS